MATTNKTSGKTDSTPTIKVEYDYGTKGERRIKEFPAAAEASKFIKAKEKGGKNPKQIKPRRQAAKKPKFKVTAVTEVNLGPATAKPAPDPKNDPSRKPPSVPGVRPMRTRPYLAGMIIAKYGFAAGVTDAMVAELDVAYGKANPTESRWCLKNAFHSARGYVGIAENSIQ